MLRAGCSTWFNSYNFLGKNHSNLQCHTHSHQLVQNIEEQNSWIAKPPLCRSQGFLPIKGINRHMDKFRTCPVTFNVFLQYQKECCITINNIQLCTENLVYKHGVTLILNVTLHVLPCFNQNLLQTLQGKTIRGWGGCVWEKWQRSVSWWHFD